MSKQIDATSFVPIRKGEWELEPDGRISIRRRKFGKMGTSMLRAARINPVLTLRLDNIASRAWEMMDGRTVGELVDALEERYPEEGRLAERVGLFLSQLVKSRLLELEDPFQPNT